MQSEKVTRYVSLIAQSLKKEYPNLLFGDVHVLSDSEVYAFKIDEEVFIIEFPHKDSQFKWDNMDIVPWEILPSGIKRTI